jgi:hypothetical protein
VNIFNILFISGHQAVIRKIILYYFTRNKTRGPGRKSCGGLRAAGQAGACDTVRRRKGGQHDIGISILYDELDLSGRPPPMISGFGL